MVEIKKIDSEILVKARKGEVKAFDLIISFYQKAIFNHIYRLVGNKDDAADLTQDTFFKIYRKHALIDPSDNFKAWLYKIATNTVYDWFDKKKRRNEFNFIEEGEIETIGAVVPYYRLDKATTMDLEMALGKIKPRYQSVIFLYYQQGFSYEEIAKIMQTPLGTVKTLLYRAKRALEEELKYGESNQQN